MFSTDFIFRQQENLVDNQKSQAGFRPLRNKILFETLKPLILKNFTAASIGEEKFLLCFPSFFGVGL